MNTPEFGHGTHVGRVRDHNEDNYLADPAHGLWVVADGMGGAACGEVASAIVVEHIAEAIGSGLSLVQALSGSHHAVLQGVETGKGMAGMGSTGVAMQLQNDAYDIAWVGDSRAYLWDGKQLRQLSRDHSFVQQLVDAGAISEEEALTHPQRNIITQSLGASQLDDVQVDAVHGRFHKGEQILLCSDGLTGEVSDAQIAQILSLDLTEQQKVDQLIQQACDNGGSDNVTAMLISSPSDAKKQKGRQKTRAINAQALNQKVRKNRARKWFLITLIVLVLLMTCGSVAYWMLSRTVNNGVMSGAGGGQAGGTLREATVAPANTPVRFSASELLEEYDYEPDQAPVEIIDGDMEIVIEVDTSNTDTLPAPMPAVNEQ